MDATVLVERIARYQADRAPVDHLRMALLLLLHTPDIDDSVSESRLEQLCQEMSMQLSAADDQHAAVADELDSLAVTAPCDFSPDHLWTLVRAIKIQSRILNLYLGPTHVGSAT